MTNNFKRTWATLVVGCFCAVISCSSPSTDSPAVQPDAQSTVGIRNFMQLQETLVALTGVEPREANLDYLTAARSRLSMDGNVEKVSAAMLLATTAVVGSFCGPFIAKESQLPSASRQVHGSVNFSGGIAAFSSNVRDEVIQSYASLFWRRSPTDEEKSALVTLATDTQQNSSSPKNTLTEVLLSICTAVGSSLDSLQI